MEKEFTTTKMSSRGQIVIPESIRSEMGLEAGSRFVVMWHGDVVMLKVISPPSIEDFNAVQKRLQKAVKKTGLKRKDIAKAVTIVRRRS
ncbi:MAG: AbrB/MazE/SpoVT family DNA-binding domain-containing protein [Planctomycetota bacterium]